VFFFLAEYASIVLICIFSVILFIGGFLVTFTSQFAIILGLINSLSLGFKTCFFIFVFIWVRASFPRIRFDQLMSFCWTILLPIIIGLIIIIPCLNYDLFFLLQS
jgi:NADH-ubiquinone oxidoreductase chain 1